jgi:hypothetical protein
MLLRHSRAGRHLLAAALLTLTAPAAAGAQVSEGVPTSLAMAVAGGIATVNAVAYPPASYAGRDTARVPHYIERPFAAEEREVLRSRFGIEEPGRLCSPIRARPAI